MTRNPPALVFTDLDGTLLDHDSYDWSPAAPLLGRLTAAGIPVVLASSKTGAEMVPLRREMGLQGAPLICENGAGVIAAGPGPAAADRDAYERLRAGLDALPRALRGSFEGFGDMGPGRIAEITGLAPDAAAAAALRAFSEPGLWHGDAAGQDRFLAGLAERGITGRRGGRFLTLSFGGTKADRMDEIAGQYGRPVTIALGDAPNDREMLETADYGIVIANAHGTPLPPLAGETGGEGRGGRIRRSRQPGPHGWSAELAGLLSDLGIATQGAARG
ncbi:HAD-IIB family hydrolase [Marinibacterium sp. SX1]|uniref:HAD-IIB family hydrolase n=1 Tax=Marinibacterium sp. SX1 TaxID=3388424 RepID=UPI003D18459C